MLPVMALPGGYGGMVVADGGLATLACCLRRDTVTACRTARQGVPVGEAVESFVQDSCQGVRVALAGARRAGPWLTVGPLSPGMHPLAADGLLRVGNAAGESHPLIGEGIAMAIQSAALLAGELTRLAPGVITARSAHDLQARYAHAWRQAFSRRLNVAAVYAHIAMRPLLANTARTLMRGWPLLLTQAARVAGKARFSGIRPSSHGVHHEYT
jgi:flavin-dependent dehydrogenase